MNEGGETVKMLPEDAARYWKEQHDWLARLLEQEQAHTEKLGQDGRDFITTIRVLTRLLGRSEL